MSDKDQNDIPKEQNVADDGDIDNLSQTEKAAFEKIMAQIGEADDETPAKEADPEKPESSKVADTPPDPPQPDDPDQPDDTKAENTDDDNDQKNEDDLNDDQRAALDKIMAEIGGEDEKEPSTTADETGNSEGDEQQANLDKIMAEINGDETHTDSSTDDEALSDDQQVALDQIMSEIKGADENSDNTASNESLPDSDTDSEEKSSDPASKQPTEQNQAQPAPSDDKSQRDEEADGLSLEEFDDELSSLLTEAGSDKANDNKAATKASPKKQDPAPTDQSLEDINSALKNIVKKSDDSETGTETETDPKQAEYLASSTVLEEVGAVPPTKRSKNSSASPLKKRLLSACIACTVLLVAAATYWVYTHKIKPDAKQHDVVTASESSVPDTQSIKETTSGAALSSPDTTVSPSAPKATASAAKRSNSFEDLKKDILSTRRYIQKKKEEILELKSYYQNGIREERNKLLANRPSKPLSFKAAIEIRQVELGLRSIQRRTSYTIKLDKPLEQIEAYLEQLLYFERRILLFELLENAISGLSLSELKRQGTDIIDKFRKEIDQLSVEQVKADPPSLKSIWQGLTDGQGSASVTAATRSNPQDQRISKSICKGSFERKYLLTSLTGQTAQCLAKWPGKDLYLNALTHLTPETAKALTQWQGEWLSLNGIKTLSPESARHLSQWPGKRLSLNGVTRLSAEATTYLAQWQGEQLEMVGLTSIGRWENYVTHLFLSESLRRKLQVQ